MQQIELNKKQDVMLKALKKFYAACGRMPSIRELREAIKEFGLVLKSSRSIFMYLDELEDKKFIRRNPKTKIIEILDSAKMSFVEIPIYGNANCGVASIIADQYLQGTLRVSKSLLKKKNAEEIFAIQASGNSMNNYKIHGNVIKDGDFVLVDGGYRPTPADKDVPVLAVVDGLATIKLLKYLGEGRIGLFPSSTEKEFSPIYLTVDDDLIINGKVVDVLKA